MCLLTYAVDSRNSSLPPEFRSVSLVIYYYEYSSVANTESVLGETDLLGKLLGELLGELLGKLRSDCS